MTDRELLEKAAKAAGYGKVEWMVGTFGVERPHVRFDDSWSWTHWNPLTDDGDALRLAVKLNMDIGFDTLPDGAIAWAALPWSDQWDEGCRVMEWLHKDPCAATRRAIVRAAAAMSEQ